MARRKIPLIAVLRNGENMGLVRVLWVLFIVLLMPLSSVMGQPDSTTVTLIMKDRHFKYEESKVSSRDNRFIKSVSLHGDSLMISFRPVSQSQPINWDVHRDTTAENLESLMGITETDPNNLRITIKDSQSFSLVVRQVPVRDTVIVRDTVAVRDTVFVRDIRDTLVTFEVRKLSHISKYTFIPGGARFFKNRLSKPGFVIGIGEVVPIGLWFYFNNKRIKYLEDAREATIQTELDRLYDRAQSFRRRQNVSGAIFAGCFLFNMADTILNVKERIGRSIKVLRDVEGWEFTQQGTGGDEVYSIRISKHLK